MASWAHDYTIAWICALPLERAAARVMLDRTHNPSPKLPADSNAYEFGELNGHYIVIASLPWGVYGTVSAATVVSRMRSTFPQLQYGLMVGIGGGVPSNKNDIRLGDVVVSKPDGKYSGVIQYDYGKTVQGGEFEQTGALNKPPPILLTHIGQLQANRMTGSDDGILKVLDEALERCPNMKEDFSPPEQHTDLLFDSSYSHVNKEDTCEKCDKQKLITRQPRDTRAPHIHYGLIASGDQVMKDSKTRDRLAQQHEILCFEMEAAGLMDELPTLVIRGICDYCDSHKQKQWQGYAALTAAAYTKVLLSVVNPAGKWREQITNMRQNQLNAEILDWLSTTNFATQVQDLLNRQVDETGKWLIDSPIFRQWDEGEEPQIMLCQGIPGSGKTVMASIVCRYLQDKYDNYDVGVACFFCDFRRVHEQDTLKFLLSLLCQLVQQQGFIPDSIEDWYTRYQKRRSLPLLGEIKEALHAVCSHFDRLYVVVDALDECQGDDGNYDEETFEALCRLQKETGARVFLTSRVIPVIKEAFPGSLLLQIHAREEDLRLFVESRLRRSRLKKFQTLFDSIITEVSKAADGMQVDPELHF